MSFWSIIKTVGRDILEVAPTVGSVVSIFNPALGGLITGISGKLQTDILNAEATVAMPKSGATKSAMVVQDFEDGLSLFQDVLAVEGKALTYDPVALQQAIDSQVAAFNAAAALKASLKIVAKAKPAG